jgi:hypothetical protein
MSIDGAIALVERFGILGVLLVLVWLVFMKYLPGRDKLFADVIRETSEQCHTTATKQTDTIESLTKVLQELTNMIHGHVEREETILSSVSETLQSIHESQLRTNHKV